MDAPVEVVDSLLAVRSIPYLMVWNTTYGTGPSQGMPKQVTV